MSERERNLRAAEALWKDHQWIGQTFIAIVADASPLSLPVGVEGLAGLAFLRQFARWGAERSEAGWRFCLSDESWSRMNSN